MQNSIFSEDEAPQSNKTYQVLARKYRPQSFDDLIGQDVLVQTLTNSIKSERIAHAFVLTGIRGVGKTTTARIIAKALNCISPEADNKPTIKPCGVCEQCMSISDDRNQDILEMDAASHTGVNDIREIIENVKYKPISARFKVYIIDEVHMLSNSAFNALLKTLEEPPEHVKFIFATTEIRKIPITILSRCQRFDLKRVSVEDLMKHYENVTNKESYKINSEALKLIAKAASGSVRDGLSILDQAISLSEGTVTEEIVRQMLGTQDSENLYNLFKSIAGSNTEQSLKTIQDMYSKGSDPLLIAQDLLEVCYIITKVKLSEQSLKTLSETEATLAQEISSTLEISNISQLWMMLTKGLSEIKNSSMPLEALEMMIIRVCYASGLPSIENLIKQNALNDNSAANNQVDKKKIQ